MVYVPNVLRAKSARMGQRKLESLLGRRPRVDVVHQQCPANALEGGASVAEVGSSQVDNVLVAKPFCSEVSLKQI
jgi:hypothetical protein